MFDYWKRLKKKSKMGFQGFPAMTVAFYGPDNKFASKVAVSYVTREGEEAEKIERFFSDDKDIRKSVEIGKKVASLLTEWKPATVTMPMSILGCPHETGIDYPQGLSCPECPFWRDKDRFEDFRKELGEKPED